jgi:hypothetical protein
LRLLLTAGDIAFDRIDYELGVFLGMKRIGVNEPDEAPFKFDVRVLHGIRRRATVEVDYADDAARDEAGAAIDTVQEIRVENVFAVSLNFHVGSST